MGVKYSRGVKFMMIGRRDHGGFGRGSNNARSFKADYESFPSRKMILRGSISLSRFFKRRVVGLRNKNYSLKAETNVNDKWMSVGGKVGRPKGQRV